MNRPFPGSHRPISTLPMVDQRISSAELLYAVTDSELNILCELALNLLQVAASRILIPVHGKFQMKGLAGLQNPDPDLMAAHYAASFETGQTIVLADVPRADSNAPRALALHPLRIEQTVVGIFCVYDPEPRPDFNQPEFLQSLNNLSSLANAVLSAGFLRQRASARPDIFRQSPFGMLVWSVQPNWRVTYISDQARLLLGDDLFISATDSGFLSLLATEHVAAYQRILLNHRVPGTAEQELSFQLQDRATWISQYSYPEYDNNGVLQSVYCYLLNTSAQKSVELQLERARLEMYVRLDSVAIGTWSFDPATNLRTVSPRMAEILGFPAAELQIDQTEWVALMHPDDRAHVSAATMEEMQNRQRNPDQKPRLRSVEYRIRNRDGIYLWVQSGGAFVESAEHPGKFVLLGSFIDINARKQAEIALTERRALLSIVQQAQQQFMLSRDLQAAFQLILNQLLRLLKCSFGCVALVHQNAEKQAVYQIGMVLDVFGYTPPARPADNTDRAPGGTLFAQLMMQATPVFFNGAQPLPMPVAAGLPVPESYLGLPLFFNGEMNGLLALVNRTQDFSEETVEMLSPLSLSLGALIHTRQEEEKRISTEARLARLAVTDTLTGILNRRGFFEKNSDFLALFRRYGTPSTIAIIDIDFFKRVNDRYGHITGDDVLRQVAASLSASVRDTDVVARFGGEEFVILFAATAMQQAYTVMERIRLGIADMSLLSQNNQEEFYVTISAGLAQLSETENSSDKWIAAADVALYQAKELGRNQVICYDSGAQSAVPSLTGA